MLPPPSHARSPFSRCVLWPQSPPSPSPASALTAAPRRVACRVDCSVSPLFPVNYPYAPSQVVVSSSNEVEMDDAPWWTRWRPTQGVDACAGIINPCGSGQCFMQGGIARSAPATRPQDALLLVPQYALPLPSAHGWGRIPNCTLLAENPWMRHRLHIARLHLLFSSALALASPLMCSSCFWVCLVQVQLPLPLCGEHWGPHLQVRPLQPLHVHTVQPLRLRHLPRCGRRLLHLRMPRGACELPPH